MRGFVASVANFARDEDGARVIALAVGAALVFVAFSKDPALSEPRAFVKEMVVAQAKALQEDGII